MPDLTIAETYTLAKLKSAKEHLEVAVPHPRGIRDLRVLNTLNDSLAGLAVCICAIAAEGRKHR